MTLSFWASYVLDGEYRTVAVAQEAIVMAQGMVVDFPPVSICEGTDEQEQR